MSDSDCRSAATRTVAVQQIFPAGRSSQNIERPIAIEAPIALEFNGLGYAVMMATPCDLTDFVTGFAITERLVERPDQIASIHVHQTETHGLSSWIIRVNLAAEKADAVFERARTRVAESSCGLCGLENLELVAKPLPRVAPHDPVDKAYIFKALAELAAYQPINAATGGVHAAAWVDACGNIACVREDVGRHNALDKLIGAMVKADMAPGHGFILTTSRCSYEIVEKAVIAGATQLVTISVPTSLAITRAEQSGLSLVSLARADSALRMGE